ncbi:MAG: RNA-binding S4 domain-containing protein [Lachnospiraceae bacterium]|nr:RNA-binding S4 domain-containing protein [Lachnospiraceae bacterium]
METVEIREGEEFIKLGQVLKKAGLVSSGVEAKMVIQEGEVSVDGEIDTRRGRKLFGGEVISYNGEEVKIVK